MRKPYGLILLWIICLLLVVGCSDKETSNDASIEETPVENVQGQETVEEASRKETAPKEEAPTQTKPTKELPNDTKTGGERPAPPTGAEADGPAPPAEIPSATTSDVEGPSELEEQKIRMLMDEYMTNYPLAVNEGAFIYIMHLIDPTSVFYHAQAEYVLDTYERNIKETLLYYEVSKITPIEEDTYQITVQESFGVYFGDEARETVMDFENIYTVKKFPYGVFLITDLQVTGLM